MEIKICNTKEWTDKEWESFVSSFYEVFQHKFDIEHFKHKYYATIDGYSYHALLLNDEGVVVGNISIIPYFYNRNEEKVKIGLGADVFIREEFRTDPLMLRRMYKKLTKLLVENGIVAVMAVPNATAYPYWKNVVKWKDVGDIAYWAIPVRVGNVIKKYNFLNFFSLIYTYLILFISRIINLFVNSKQKNFLYSVNENNSFFDYRFYGDYHQEKKGDNHTCYRIIDEEGVKTAYLVYSKEKGCMTFRSLLYGVKQIIKNHKVDLILFVGPIRLFQTLFIHIPHRIEPKRLPLTCDLLTNDERFQDMLVFSNWDFGLLNYDVR